MSYLNLIGLRIDKLSYENLLDEIQKEKISLAYVNAHTFNECYRNHLYVHLLNEFDLRHPDGIGIYFASKILYGRNGFKKRITGSDFYPMLAQKGIELGWRFFFFGHDEKTLSLIQKNYPGLIIAGTQNGIEFDSNEVIQKINSSNADILIVGLSFPKQERWIIDNKNRLTCQRIISVGDGIKVFAGIKKRGPKFMRILGFEWFTRLLHEPLKYSKRYVIGNPLFVYRIFALKVRNLF